MTHSAETDSLASKAFATRLAKYAYTPSERPRRSEAHQGRGAGEYTTPSPRRAQVASARKRAHIRDPLSSSSSEEDSEYDGADVSPSAGPSSRTLTSGKKSTQRVQDSPSVVKKAKKVPRPYAGPEVYAHLNNTPDHLAVGLDSECSSRSSNFISLRNSHFLRYKVSLSIPACYRYPRLLAVLVRESLHCYYNRIQLR